MLSAAAVTQPAESTLNIASPHAVGGHSTGNWPDPSKVPQRCAAGRSGRSIGVNEQLALVTPAQWDIRPPSEGSDGGVDDGAPADPPLASSAMAFAPPDSSTLCVVPCAARPPHPQARSTSRKLTAPNPIASTKSS